MSATRYAVWLLLVLTNAACAAVLTPEQKEVFVFMQKMYSYSADTFEFGEFGGNYLPKKQCMLMQEFFLESLLDKPQNNKSCNLGIRYPGAGSEELRYNSKPGQMPKPNLSTPKVEGDKATISVSTKDYGKVQFFLTKTDKGWRIENALYDEWPPINDGKCRSEFLRPPSAWQKKEAPLLCQ